MNYMLPIVGLIRREMLVALRRKSNFVWLTALLLCFVLMIAANWPSNDRLYLGQVGYVSRDILIWSSLILMVGAALVMPGLGAAAIISERDMDTYDQLRLTLLGDLGMILGKLVNSLGIYFLFVAGTVPAVAAAFFLVGVETFQLPIAVMCLICASVCCCLGGMAMGASFSRTIAGNVFAYVLMLMYMGLPLLFLALWGVATNDKALEDFIEWLMRMYPLIAIILSVESSRAIDLAGFVKTVLPVMAYSALASIAFLFIIWSGLKRQREERLLPSLATTSADDTAAGESARPRAKGTRYEDTISFPDFVNPVYHRESQCDARTGWTFAPKVFVTGFVFTLGNALVAAFIQTVGADNKTAIQLVLSLDMGGMALFLPATVAGIFTADFERDRVDMLRLTLLSPYVIGTAKIHKAFGNAAPIFLGILVSTGVPLLLVTKWDEMASWFFGVISLAICGVLAVCLGLVASACSSKTSGAFVAGYVLNALVFVGLMFFLVVITEAFKFHTDNSQEFVVSTSPIFAYLESFRPSMMGSSNAQTWPFRGFSLVAWVRGAFIYLALSFLLYWAALRLFARRFTRRE